jgi:Holliday junction DNA helicase RuvA
MITRVAGVLERVEEHRAVVRGGDGPTGGGIEFAFEVLVPGFVARQLESKLGARVTLHTLAYLESQNQGASFTPRLVGFLSEQDRAFFELFTTVKGIGNRRALRALAEPVGEVASAIERGDAKALTKLPEIGARMAETVIAELKGKAGKYVGIGALEGSGRGAGVGAAGAGPFASSIGAAGAGIGRSGVSSRLSVGEAEAVEALVRLGEVRSEAERKVVAASGVVGAGAGADALLGAALLGQR